MPFDEEELDPHGECAAEITRLLAALKFYADATPADFAKDNGYTAAVALAFSSQQKASPEPSGGGDGSMNM